MGEKESKFFHLKNDSQITMEIVCQYFVGIV